jgi:hypothetical protein
MSKRKRVGWDGRSRITTKKYKENYDRIFKNKKGSVLNINQSFVSKDYSEEEEKELEKLEERNGF